MIKTICNDKTTPQPPPILLEDAEYVQLRAELENARRVDRARLRDLGFNVLSIIVILGVLVALAASLLGCSTPDGAARNAAIAYHDATAAEYLAYVDADATLSPEQRDRRRLAVDTFGAWVAQQRAQRRPRKGKAGTGATGDAAPNPGDDAGDDKPAKKPTPPRHLVNVAASFLHEEFAGLLAKAQDDTLKRANAALADLATLAAASLAEPGNASKHQGETAHPLSTLATCAAITNDHARERYNRAVFQLINFATTSILGALVRPV
jgi:hypothetical protein